jgi:hypothetical protein
MLPKRDLSYINNLKQLRKAKLLANQEIEFAEIQLEQTFSQMPMRTLGGVFGFVAGMVSKGIKDKSNSAFSSTVEENKDVGLSFKSGMQTLGTELAIMGITKLITKLLSKKKG